MAEDIGVAQEFIPTLVDLADNLTIIYEGPCILRGTYVDADLSNAVAQITDGSTTKFALPPIAPAGTDFNHFDATMDQLIIDPDDAMTGAITVVWKPFTTPYEPIT